jgi:hypothetical protein
MPSAYPNAFTEIPWLLVLMSLFKMELQFFSWWQKVLFTYFLSPHVSV